jgi:ABC-type spermidine/putrescine transport systems, ATPase components
MVEVRDVSKRFDDFIALDRVSLEIAEGEFMTFLGPSGCGKTTCLRLISGFEQPTSGQILIAGQTFPRTRLTSGTSIRSSKATLFFPTSR